MNAQNRMPPWAKILLCSVAILAVLAAAYFMTPSAPELPAEPSVPATSRIEKEEIVCEEGTCILAVRCDTALNNFDKLDPAKRDILPADGVIFATKKVSFVTGESVFDLLKREMKTAKIPLEFTPGVGKTGAYIEGIANLYEFDCGALSGWEYRVNGVFPSGGSNSVPVQTGDKIEWLYSCDLGRDIGDN
ncbi:MAG: DUF4430 domain-containing protein [Oscillospiraceae bacterium]|jgi:hypothetical protein|nr:DUF4430 domain-containing protein [Oscillospiraceae bacterium]